jgi:hypothetical protein
MPNDPVFREKKVARQFVDVELQPSLEADSLSLGLGI